MSLAKMIKLGVQIYNELQPAAKAAEPMIDDLKPHWERIKPILLEKGKPVVNEIVKILDKKFEEYKKKE